MGLVTPPIHFGMSHTIRIEYTRGPDIARVRDRRIKYRYIGTIRYAGTNRENWQQKKKHRTDTVDLSTEHASVVYAAHDNARHHNSNAVVVQ